MNHIIAIVIFIQDIFISLITVINTSNKKITWWLFTKITGNTRVYIFFFLKNIA